MYGEIFHSGIMRSESQLLSDFSACRQFRHIAYDQRKKLVSASLSYKAHVFAEDHTLPKTSISKKLARVGEAFQLVMYHKGYSCDICDAIVTGLDEDQAWRAGQRSLANMDGQVKLMCCKKCSTSYKQFCKREFGREASVPYSEDVALMMHAFIASAIVRAYKQWKRAVGA